MNENIYYCYFLANLSRISWEEKKKKKNNNNIEIC